MLRTGDKIKCKNKPWNTLYIREGKYYEIIDIYAGQIFLKLKLLKLVKSILDLILKE
jgi:hypothetical protein